MKTLPTCLCILGFATASLAGGSVLLDQIGADDGSDIDITNMLANQIFEAGFAAYDIGAVDDFDNPDGSDIMSVELVFGGWNGYAGPTGVSGYNLNIYSSATAPCGALEGDLLATYTAAADADLADPWGPAGYAKAGVGGGSAGAGMMYVSLIPNNEFGSNGQTGCAISLIDGGFNGFQANPNGGFGFDCQDTATNQAYRIMGGQSNPCDSALPAVCAADVSGPDGVPDGLVNVQDLLTVIANWGQVGDGTFRPQGDCAPMDYGDCVVNVQDLLAVIAQWGSDCVERGACCYGDGSCVDNTAEGDCDGDWLGANSDCAADCVSGACCFPDGSCASATEAGCTGAYQGDGTDCGSVVCEEAPDNNTCDSAIAVGDGTHDIDNTTATTDGPEDFTNCDNFGVEQIYNDLYWSYTASCSGTATVSTCNTVDFDSRISIYADCDFTQIACNDDALSGACGLTSEVSWYCVEGETVIVRIGNFGEGAGGSGTFTISCLQDEPGACCIGTSQCVDGLLPSECEQFGGQHQGGGTDCAVVECDPTPENDECEFATVVGVGAHPFDTTYANPEWPDPDDTQCSGTYLDWAGSPDVFFSFTADGDGVANISLCDAASYDTSIAIYGGTCADPIQLACNGDHSGQTGCQSYYSAIDNLPMSDGETILIRIGGWNAATGPGTCTIDFTGGNETAACCVGGSCAGELTFSDCEDLGGLWNQGLTCAEVDCPAPFTGCDGTQDANETDHSGDINGYACVCHPDGFDTAQDCNGGLNGDGSMTPYPIPSSLCGAASVYIDGPSGGQYRDTDWMDDGGTLDAGGTFDVSVGSGGAMLHGFVDLDALAFIDYVINPEGWYVSGSITAAAGNHCVWTGASDWNTAWTCDSGLADYQSSVE